MNLPGTMIGTVIASVRDQYEDQVKEKLKAKGFTPSSSEVTMVPTTTVKVEGDDAQKVIKLVTSLEEHDDVQNVHANFDISDEILEKAS